MDRPGLSVVTRSTPSEVVVTVSGEIDMSTADHLAGAVNEVLKSDPPARIIMDLRDVTFCDSQGLGTLVILSRKATFVHSCLILTNVRDFLLRVFEITGLRDALTVRP